MDDYNAAAKRHWADAKLLDKEKRRENADHHYGFAAECALKSALQAMGYFRENEHRKHTLLAMESEARASSPR